MEEPLASALLAPVDDAISSTRVASMDRFPLSVVRVVDNTVIGNIDCFVVQNVVASNAAGFALPDTEVVAVDIAVAAAYIGLDIVSAAIVVYVVAVAGVGNSLVRNAILCSQ